jgi:hypothetical protein
MQLNYPSQNIADDSYYSICRNSKKQHDFTGQYISKYNTNSPILQIKRGTFTTKSKGFDPKITKKEDDIKLTYSRH